MSDTTMYTTGSWKVSRQTQDTAVTGKENHTISLPVVNFSKDYAIRSEETKQGSTCVLTNTTGDRLGTTEVIRYGSTLVDDVYKRMPNFNVTPAQCSRTHNGKQVLCEVRHLYKAENTVSGEELYLPALARLTVVLPDHPSVTSAMLDDIVKRLNASLFCTSQDATVSTYDRLKECAKDQCRPEDL